MDENQPAETKLCARNLVSAYRRRFVEKAHELVEAGDGAPINNLWHYVELADVFVDECLEENGELKLVLGELRLAAWGEELRWLSRAEKRRLLHEISLYDETEPHP